MPNVKSCMEQGKFWTDTLKLVKADVTEDQLFDLSMAKEATARLKSSNPFG
jgi:hypothetical protein